jgi:hemerythrin
MSDVRWKNEFRLGVPEMDAEHEKLINLAGNLREAFYRNEDSGTVGKIIDDILHFALTHFHNEEAFMKTIQFPGYSSHKEQHKALAMRILKLREEHETDTGDVSVDVLDLIHDWLIDHFQAADRQYAAFLTEDRKASAGMSGS